MGSPHLPEPGNSPDSTSPRRIVMTNFGGSTFARPPGVHQHARAAAPDCPRAKFVAIYNWFSEGFDTPHLKEAKVLVNELA